MSNRILGGTGILGGYSFEDDDGRKTRAPETGSKPTEAEMARLELVTLDAAQQTVSQHDDRELAIATLNALIDFGRGELPGLKLWTLVQLVGQLGDLDFGIKGAMLVERAKIGAPPLGTWQSVIKVYSAAYLQMLREANLSVPKAKARVTSKLGPTCRRFGLELGKSTVVNWRKQLSRSRSADVDLFDRIDAELFDRLLASWRSRINGAPTVHDADNWIEALDLS